MKHYKFDIAAAHPELAADSHLPGLYVCIRYNISVDGVASVTEDCIYGPFPSDSVLELFLNLLADCHTNKFDFSDIGSNSEVLLWGSEPCRTVLKSLCGKIDFELYDSYLRSCDEVDKVSFKLPDVSAYKDPCIFFSDREVLIYKYQSDIVYTISAVEV